MDKELINSCYENEYGFDLKQFHIDKCRISEDEQSLVYEINKAERCIFSDNISAKFELIIYDNLVYLLGDKSCYPCSNVINSAYGKEYNWVKCWIIPHGKTIIGETDIRKSAIMLSQIIELIEIIKDEKILFNYLDGLKITFSQCRWFKEIYSLSIFIRLAKFWNYQEKIKKLFEHGLIYPLELVLYCLYKKVAPNREIFIEHFLRSLSESTNKIFDQKEIKVFLNSLSEKDIQIVLAFNEVASHIYFQHLTDNSFADLLEIDTHIRYTAFINGIYHVYYARENANRIFKNSTFRNDYLKILKKNFRDLENQLRGQKGFENVGTYFMERLLFYRLKDAFPALTIIPQYSPEWLYPQRIDIFVSECNMAIEYNGEQHYKPVDYFGGKNGYEKIKALDQVKYSKCYEHSVRLIIIKYDEDLNAVLTSLIEQITQLINSAR